MRRKLEEIVMAADAISANVEIQTRDYGGTRMWWLNFLNQDRDVEVCVRGCQGGAAHTLKALVDHIHAQVFG